MSESKPASASNEHDRALTRHRQRVARWLSTLGPMIGLAFAWGLFAALAGWDFMRWNNQQLMLMQTAVVATAAVGATLVIISGSIDLSVGSMIALGTMIVALLLNLGCPGWVAGLGGIASGMVVGLFVGIMVVGWGGRAIALIGGSMRNLPLSSFIVTLGLLSALRGVAKGVGGSQPIYPMSSDAVRGATESLTGLMSRTIDLGAFTLPAASVWILLGLAILMSAMLRYTRFGRHIFAVGSNEQTARLCGVPVAWVRLRVFMIAMACTGLAAVFQFGYLGMGDPTTAQGYELRVIAACVIGGASLAGGEGSIGGAIIGALIMTVIANGCTKLGLDNWVQQIVTGGIIIVAVLLDQLRHGRR